MYYGPEPKSTAQNSKLNLKYWKVAKDTIHALPHIQPCNVKQDVNCITITIVMSIAHTMYQHSLAITVHCSIVVHSMSGGREPTHLNILPLICYVGCSFY